MSEVVEPAVDEVVDFVRAGVGPGDEIRPRDRALRRHAGAEVRERAGRGELAEVGQLARVHQLLQQHGVEAVHADDQQPRGVGVRAAAAAHQAGQEKATTEAQRHSGGFWISDFGFWIGPASLGRRSRERARNVRTWKPRWRGP
jgi:hypothetical protein